MITCGETWVTFLNVETKVQSKQWMHSHSPDNPKNIKQTSARQLMASVFWDRNGVLMVKFVQRGTAVTSEVYCEMLKNCVCPFRKKGASTYSCSHLSTAGAF
jgi:hypothetical protein